MIPLLLIAASALAAEDPIVEGFRKTTVASVSDAVDQITGQRGYLSHDMRPRIIGANIPDRFVGRATTAILKATTKEKASAQLSAKHSVEMIDNAQPGSVGVIVVEGSLDVAGMGGLMATAASARGMAGVLLDGGLRDLAEIRALRLPVFSRSVVPSSSVSRWASVARDIPVTCGGVVIMPGDYIIAGEDGVVRVPAARAAEVLKRAQEIDVRESSMVPDIKKNKSLGKTVEQFKRI